MPSNLMEGHIRCKTPIRSVLTKTLLSCISLGPLLATSLPRGALGRMLVLPQQLEPTVQAAGPLMWTPNLHTRHKTAARRTPMVKRYLCLDAAHPQNKDMSNTFCEAPSETPGGAIGGRPFSGPLKAKPWQAEPTSSALKKGLIANSYALTCRRLLLRSRKLHEPGSLLLIYSLVAI